jgi:7-carboxy-7-deazaguanine synthase
MDLDRIVDRVRAFDTRHVCVTGGEPLAQAGSLDLMRMLCDAGHTVSLETSGALDIAAVDPRVTRVLDLKTPSSGEGARNRYENLDLLRAGDQVKFVLMNRADYDWAMSTAAEYALADRVCVLFSPAWGQLDAALLVDWMLADRLPYRLQLQLHKILWGEAPGR